MPKGYTFDGFSVTIVERDRLVAAAVERGERICDVARRANVARSHIYRVLANRNDVAARMLAKRNRNARIVAAARDGKRATEIAAEEGISVGRVYALLRQASAPYPSAGRRAKRRERDAMIKEAKAEGVRAADIAAATGLSEMHVYAIIRDDTAHRGYKNGNGRWPQGSSQATRASLRNYIGE